LSAGEAETAIAAHFGVVDAVAERLDTERDDSFRMRSPHGDFVFKVAHPDDDPLLINLQTAALAHAADTDPAIPLQRILPSLDGEIEPVITLANGDQRIARVLTWLPGAPLYTVGPNSPDARELELLGEMLGRLSAALASFEHPAARREFAWDVAQLPAIRPLLTQFPSDEVAETFALFERAVLPLLGQLPRQVAFNDFHQGNVLVDTSHPAFISGVIDFGDLVHTVRVADVAVAISYLLHPGNHSWTEIELFVAGFTRHVRLTPLELEVLQPLVAARFAGRILVNQFLSRGNPDDRAETAAAAAQNQHALGELLRHAPTFGA
jgi:Ser/Thr protein kinase RdoA (MazF antagonist)